MRGLSTKPECIIQCLSLYSGINVKLANSICGIGPARFRSPKEGREGEGEPHIVFYNADSQKVYQICEEGDRESTQCIIRLIREKFFIPEGEESLFYILFVVLHEAGHWYDYHNRRDWFNQNIVDQANETAEEYRRRPCEESADRFALDNFENAWNELNTHLFHGMMDTLERAN